MALYIVTYDLTRPGQDYESLWTALRNLGARRGLESVWFLKSNSKAEAIRDHLRKFQDQNDRLFVGNTDADWASINLMFKLSEF